MFKTNNNKIIILIIFFIALIPYGWFARDVMAGNVGVQEQ